MTPLLERLSIVIVTWNGDDLLKECLDSLVKVYEHLPETIAAADAAALQTPFRAKITAVVFGTK